MVICRRGEVFALGRGRGLEDIDLAHGSQAAEPSWTPPTRRPGRATVAAQSMETSV